MKHAFRLSVALALVASLALPVAAAHERIPVGDEYRITLGWDNEPPLVDQPNAVWIKVEKMGDASHDAHEDEHAHGDGLDSGEIAPGGNFTHTFAEPGTFTYHCHPHPTMTGAITIEPAGHGHAPETHTVRIVDFGFEPATLTIHAGDTVVWVNEGNATHTITQDAAAEHAEGGSSEGGHGHEAGTPVGGLEESLNVTVSIGGKERTMAFKAVHGETGVYVARFIPTVAGTYSVHITGDIHGEAVDITRDIQKVEPLSAYQFPETTRSLHELSRDVAALKAEAETQANTPAPVEGQKNGIPAAGLALAAVAAVGVALALRRRG